MESNAMETLYTVTALVVKIRAEYSCNLLSLHLQQLVVLLWLFFLSNVNFLAFHREKSNCCLGNLERNICVSLDSFSFKFEVECSWQGVGGNTKRKTSWRWKREGAAFYFTTCTLLVCFLYFSPCCTTFCLLAFLPSLCGVIHTAI